MNNKYRQNQTRSFWSQTFYDMFIYINLEKKNRTWKDPKNYEERNLKSGTKLKVKPWP